MLVCTWWLSGDVYLSTNVVSAEDLSAAIAQVGSMSMAQHKCGNFLTCISCLLSWDLHSEQEHGSRPLDLGRSLRAGDLVEAVGWWRPGRAPYYPKL